MIALAPTLLFKGIADYFQHRSDVSMPCPIPLKALLESHYAWLERMLIHVEAA